MLAAFWLLIPAGSQDAEVLRLIERLRSESVEQRAEAARELEEREDEAVLHLAPLLTDADAEVSARARDILERIRQRNLLVPLAARREFPLALRTILRGDATERGRLLEVFWRAEHEGKLSVRDVLPLFLEYLDVDEPTTIPKFDPVRGARPDPWRLGDLARQMLERTLDRSDFRTRAEWHRWWEKNRDRPEREWYLPDLDAPHGRDRAWAVNRLARLGDRDSLPRLFGILPTLKDPSECAYALRGFEGWRGAKVIEGLHPYLSDRRWEVRLAAARALHPRVGGEPVDRVLEAVEHPDRMEEERYWERRECLEWLAEGVDVARVPRVWKAASGDPRARESVRRTLARRKLLPEPQEVNPPPKE